ncbi:MAG TPA: lycopene cyclase domain-containing protein [Sporichthyaceae bacterium]|nr:lycopene cyclase domain-containing protein [Sporichthyaceae bacterium]
MRHLSYLAMLAVCAAFVAPLEWVLGARVLRRPRRLSATLAVVLVPFVAWDLIATAAGQWSFDRRQTVDVRLPGGMAIEEIAFFVVIPVAVLLTLEAVRTLRGRR